MIIIFDTFLRSAYTDKSSPVVHYHFPANPNFLNIVDDNYVQLLFTFASIYVSNPIIRYYFCK